MGVCLEFVFAQRSLGGCRRVRRGTLDNDWGVKKELRLLNGTRALDMQAVELSVVCIRMGMREQTGGDASVAASRSGATGSFD